MKITKLSLCVSMAGLLATLPAAYANEVVTNCTQVSSVDGGDSNVANNEACAALTIPFDYGDAPDPSFTTLDASGGARHQLGTDVYLGKCVDGDTGLLQGGASVDNADNGSPVYGTCDPASGDEDGVAIAPLHVGDTNNVVQVTANAACKLNAWVDWNQDGSWGGAGEQVFIDQVLSAGRNDLTMDVPAFATEGTIYTRFRCSTAGGDGIGGEAADGEVEDYALNILPAIPKIPVSVGDTIWEDTNKDGKQTAGENPLAGVVVTLLDSVGAPAKDLTGTIVADVTTDATGKYLFSNLPEGAYSVKVAPPTGYIPTLNAGDVDTVPANDDSNCSVQGDGSITTALFTLSAGGEPDTAQDGDDTNGNMTVDCGFYQPTEAVHSIGNMVWVDDGAGVKANAGNGKFDDGETLPNGVKVELRDNTGTVLDSTLTAGGYYLFAGMAAGEYHVCVSANNFSGVGKLIGYTAGIKGKETDANLDGDNNDNGDTTIEDGLCSSLVLIDDKEPKGESATMSGVAGDDGAGTEDNRSNLTVDFAVIPPKTPVPVSVGDTIWVDTNEDGVQDVTELPLMGAIVTLLNQDGTPVKNLAGKAVADLLTGADGKYLFSNLPEGDYTITVKAPAGYLPTKGGADADTDTSNTDSNCAVVGSNVQTPAFSLIAGSQPIDDGDTDANSNLSVDCGFYQPKAPTHSLGNRVWIDTNNNGLADAGEMPATAGITLELKDDTGAVVTSTVTDANGRYLFGALAAGSYQVCVVADNFIAGNVLADYTASTGGNIADANTDIDGDDNGSDDTSTGLCSNLVVLDDKEPSGEASANGIPGDDGIGTDDTRSNLTVDFGIVPPAEPAQPVAVGDYLWIDTNHDGLQSEGETGLAGATVTLLDKDGKPAKDMDGNAIAPSVTGADGLYGFTKLAEGDYSISVTAPEGYLPTQNAGKVDDVPANNDSNCAVQADGSVSSGLFNLMAGQEPGATEDGDGTNNNLTVDCGFYQPTPGKASISGTVKADTNGDAVGEDALEGVTLALQNADGTPVLDKDGKPVTTVTDASGAYTFTDVAPGDYLVVETDLAGYTSVIDQDSTTAEDDAANTDTNDNRLPVSVVADETDDGNDFVDRKPVEPAQPVAVGDTIWIDTNHDGLQSEGETGLAGATVTLLDKDGKPAKDMDGNAIAPSITGADGLYGFTKLSEGDYSISVTAPEGYIPTQNAGKVDDVPANNDSNCAVQADGSVSSGLFNLMAGQEPGATEDGDGTNNNLTVDCGFYQPTEAVHSIGNMVWVDDGAGVKANAGNGKFDEGETLPNGVKVELRDNTGTVLDSTLTAGGYYLFAGMAAGEYQVCVSANNFSGVGKLIGYTAGIKGKETDANLDGDNNDNGDTTIEDGLCSSLVVIDDKEPKGESATMSGVAGDDGAGTEDNRSNLTVDFAVIPPVVAKPVSVGDTIWIDANEDGIQDKGELPLEGAVVTLMDKDGNPVKDLGGKDVSPATVGADGKYLFSNLPEGDYSIRVKAPEGYVATKGGVDVDDDASNTDSNCAVIGSSVQTALFTLTAGGEPIDDGDTDTNSNLSVDCGFYQPKAPTHSLGNRVWIDTNNNGLADAGELPATAGIALELKDDAGAVVTSTVTDANGRYLFGALAAGSYQVCVVADNFIAGNVLAGYTASTGGNIADANTDIDGDDNGSDDTSTGLCSNLVVLDDKEPSGEASANGIPGDDGIGTDDTRSNLTVDFGIVPPVEPAQPVAVGDYLWIDTNHDGLQSEGETGLAGATVTLLDKDGKPAKDVDGNAIAPSVTGADGLYGFTKLSEGDYSISVTAPEGYIPTQNAGKVDDVPANNDSNCAVQADGSVSSGLFNLMAGQEPGATEDGDGTNNNLTVDCGFYQPTPGKASISGTVKADTNGDTVGEDALEGVTLTLHHPDGTPVLDKDGNAITTVTDANGAYTFTDVAPGDYLVVETDLAGYTSVIDQDSTTHEDDAANTDTNDNRLPVSVVADETDDGNDFIDRKPVEPAQPVAVGDYLWIDTNHDGLQSEGETGLAGATVTLLDKDGKPAKDMDGNAIAPSITGADGLYGFTKLSEGDYSISVTAPEGYMPTQNAGKVDDVPANNDSNCAVQADGSVSSGLFNLMAGQEPGATEDGDGTNNNLTVDCGFYQPTPGTASISGTVKVDTNGDTVGEDALEGVTLALQNADGTPVLDKDGKPVTTLTDASGAYTFTDVAPGDYLVVETDLAGYTSVIDQDSTTPADDAANTDTNDNRLPVSVVADETDDGNDFVDRKPVEPAQPVAVGDYLWIDTNHDGLQSEGETGLAGATVTLLDKDGKPAKDMDGNAIAPSVTGADGLYGFTKLSEGDYSISVTAPEGYLPTQNAGKVDDVPANNDSNCAVQADGSVSSGLFNLMVGQEPGATEDGDGTNNNLTVDCGFYQPTPGKASISGTVKADTNGDAVGEDALEGVTLALQNADGTPVLDKDGKPVTTLTDASGAYTFTDVAPGDYLVVETDLAGYTSVIDQDSTTPADDAANTDTNDNRLPVSVVADETDDGNDFVDRKPVEPSTPVSVGNQIWIDSNANGLRDEGEKLLAGAVVTLTSASGRTVTDLDGNTVAPHTTGEDGLYVFGHLPEGDYIITVEPPEGFFPTIVGNDADVDPSDYDSNCRVNPINSTIETHPFTLTAGMEPDVDGDDANGNMTVDCGFYGSVSLGNKIWLDENANGQQDNAEPGISGITVSLTEDDGITPVTDISGNLVNAVTTDAEGNYLFENLNPGNYIVTIKPGKDSGYSLTKGGADPDTDPSNTDSNCKVVAGNFQTPAVTLLPGSEPGVKVDGDDESRNSTVDCGLFRPVNLGSRLWIDLNSNGQQDGGEPGIPGATVTLLTVDGKPVMDIFGDVLKPQTTGAEGQYFFGNLREGSYVVNVIPPTGYLPTIASLDPNDDNATDSNGILNADGSISSKPIDLKWGDEPSDGGATNTTVGFGLIANLHVPTLSQWGVAIMSMLLATAAFFRRRRED